MCGEPAGKYGNVRKTQVFPPSPETPNSVEVATQM